MLRWSMILMVDELHDVRAELLCFTGLLLLQPPYVCCVLLNMQGTLLVLQDSEIDSVFVTEVAHRFPCL